MPARSCRPGRQFRPENSQRIQRLWPRVPPCDCNNLGQRGCRRSSTRQIGIGTSRNCSRKFTPKCGEHSSPQSNGLKNEASCPALKMRESWSLPSSAPFCTGVSSGVSRLTKLSQKRWSSAPSAMLTDLRLIEAEPNGYTSNMISRAVGAPSGRLAAPYTKRLGFLSFPNTSCSSSEAPSATFG